MSNIDEIIAIPFRMLEVLSGGSLGGGTAPKTDSKPRSGASGAGRPAKSVATAQKVVAASQHTSRTVHLPRTAQQRTRTTKPVPTPRPTRGGPGRLK
jgi:hypothetical protein